MFLSPRIVETSNSVGRLYSFFMQIKTDIVLQIQTQEY